MKISLLSAVGLLGSLTSLPAAPLWQLDFESMTPDAPPSVVNPAVAGAVNTAPQVVSNSVSTSTLIHVVNDFTAHGLVMSGHSLLFRKSTASGQEVGLLGAASDYEGWTDYELTFDLLVGAGISGQPLNVRLTTTDGTVSVAALTFDMNGSLIFSSTLSSASDLLVSDAWKPTEINQIKVQVDSEGKRALAIVNGVLAGTLDLDLADPSDKLLGVGRVRFRNNSTNQLYASGFAIDNIATTTTLSPIPEPRLALMSALVMAGAVGLRKKARVLFQRQ